MKPTYAELVAAIAAILPNASFGEDNDGQLVIYTDLKQSNKSDNEALESF
jgi:hypothetical protein